MTTLCLPLFRGSPQMIELSFLEFHERQFYEDPFCLYVIRNAIEYRHLH